MKDRRQSKVRKSVKFRKLKFGNLKNSPYEIVKKKIPHPQSYNKLKKKRKIREKEKKKISLLARDRTWNAFLPIGPPKHMATSVDFIDLKSIGF